MRCNLVNLGAFCCAIFVPGVLMAETAAPVLVEAMAGASLTHKPVIAEMTAESAPEFDIVLPIAVDFSKVTDKGFIEKRRNLVKAVQESGAGLSTSLGTSNALLSLSEFYLAHAMTVESHSILEKLDVMKLSAEQNARKAGVSIAVSLLNPWGVDLSETNRMLLEEAGDWPNHALFRALYFSRMGEIEKAGAYLSGAMGDLLTFPEPIKEIVLPKLLEVSVYLKDWEVAKEFAKLITLNPNLNEGSAYNYLLGRTAEYGGDYLVAFDRYVKATEGFDRWSQLARLSLIRMGVKTKTLTPQDVRNMLEQSRFAWRGDALALETMGLLVEAELALQDIPAALEVLGEIIYNNRNLVTVSKAKDQANLLLMAYYADGMSGKISISKFLKGHRRIGPDYRFQKGFDSFSEKFADRFFVIGASNEAAVEYETTYNYLSVAQDLGLFPVSLERLDQLRLKQVKALIRGGQYDAAGLIVGYGAESSNTEIQNEFTLLKVKVFNLTGNTESILKTKTREPSIDYLRIKAEAYFSMADWKNAVKTYGILWKRQGRDLLFTDALNLLLSAYRENDVELALRVAKVFPDLTEAPQWPSIANGLVEKRDAIGVLKNDRILNQISETSRILDVMEVINTSSQ